MPKGKGKKGGGGGGSGNRAPRNEEGALKACNHVKVLLIQ